MAGRPEGGASRNPFLSAALVAATLVAAIPLPASAEPLPAGFVRLADIAPSIRQDIRHAGSDDFLHRKVNGYDAPVCILTRQAAQALAGVQQAIAVRGLTLIVFDCYRPARAVADMGNWTREGGPPDPQWYPKVKRGDLIAKGYVGELSTHSRGSAVDLAIARTDHRSGPKPACGAIDAETLDFGTMKFAPNCGPLITSSSSASWARQNDAAKIDITPHKIGTGKIVFMWLSWNAEAGRSTPLTFLRSNRLWLRVRERGHPPKSILSRQYLQRSNCRW